MQNKHIAFRRVNHRSGIRAGHQTDGDVIVRQGGHLSRLRYVLFTRNFYMPCKLQRKSSHNLHTIPLTKDKAIQFTFTAHSILIHDSSDLDLTQLSCIESEREHSVVSEHDTVKALSAHALDCFPL